MNIKICVFLLLNAFIIDTAVIRYKKAYYYLGIKFIVDSDNNYYVIII